MAAEEANLNDGSRLLIISNRLPLTIKRSEDGQYNFSMSSGGLVTGLSGLSKTMRYEWYGWPGLQIPENEIGEMKEKLRKECDAHPVFIDDDLADKHYNGFSSMSGPYFPQPSCPLSSLCALHALLLPRLTFARVFALQTRSFGPSSTTTPVRSPSTSPPGPPTTKSTPSSPRPSPPTYKTMT